MKRLVLFLCLAFALAGCAHYIVHPGSVNTYDSQTYDVLKSAQVTIDNSRDQINSGVLPASFKPVVNALEAAYNPAIESYKAWHTAALAGTDTPEQLRQLNAALAALNSAVALYRSTK